MGLMESTGALTLKGASMATATVSSWNGLGTHFAAATATEKNGFNGIKWGVLPLPLLLMPPSVNTCNDMVAVAVTQCERTLTRQRS